MNIIQLKAAFRAAPTREARLKLLDDNRGNITLTHFQQLEAEANEAHDKTTAEPSELIDLPVTLSIVDLVIAPIATVSEPAVDETGDQEPASESPESQEESD